MKDFSFKKWNVILGWVSFSIALITYTLTLEPTVSFWDCGEYISTAVNLEVGHPPGAPLFQMLGAFFAMFSSNPSNWAYLVNFMSGLASAFTILFMFWTITNLAKRLVNKNNNFTLGEKIAVLGSGLVGSLAYTFSDSFWFSAVEGEVYAMSSFLMAILFWLGLKWESEMHLARGNKWLIVISYVVGLSFGVHILSLLVIPSIVMLYFFKNYKDINIKTTSIATVISILVLAFVFKFLFPFTLKFFSASELFFINSIGLPYNSGTIIAALLLVGLFVYGLKYTRQKNLVWVNTAILSILFIMIGFSTWLMLPIRANADTIINENNPSSARELLAYYNREQYGDANVFYDKYYSFAFQKELEKDSNGDDIYINDKPKYEKINGKYEIVNHYENVIPKWSSKHKGFIPRMVDPGAEQYYKQIAGIPLRSQRRPTFVENLKFMFNYQFGYMYGRYFMWNFVGRQNDIQGHLDNNGNWLSGIKPIDEFFGIPQEKLPDDVKKNKGRNTYFFLPLILGIIGLLYHVKEDKKRWYTLGLFFVFTGFAIIFYTNPKPFEPRERDYAVVGSFYVFAIWIGFGVLALYEALKTYGKKPIIALAISIVSLLSVPTLMGFQNWDDHDRADRYIAQLNAQTYLESCDPNAIIFTIGDNDTFPLWYMQQIEGVRRDIKIINTSLFATDWYIDQMKKKTYDADPIPSKLQHHQYKYGTLDIAYHFPHPKLKDSVIPIKSFMDWITTDHEATYFESPSGLKEKLFPTTRIRIPVNKENALKYGIVAPKDADKMVDYIDINIDEAITKNRILMLDILNNFDWKRPIYFTGGAGADEEYIWLKDYLQLDGMAYKLVPIRTPIAGKSMFDMGRIDPEKMYNNVKKWDWKTINNGEIYLDEQAKRNAISLRNNLMRLSEEFLIKEDTATAKEVLDLSLHKMPIKDFGHYSISLGYPELYYRIGDKDKARQTAETLLDIFNQQLEHYSTYDDIAYIADDLETTIFMYQNIMAQIRRFDSDMTYKKTIEEMFNNKLFLLNHLIQIPEEESNLPELNKQELQLLDSIEMLQKQLLDSTPAK
ncbi:glycosyltransferase family 117 protein [Tenacibaculum sp. ZS6-P6]|uniref:glycosyltransferase family 117 protein n=1 Tax=Tenacibaculum sp. ZS6-P6 TaxID=3447503 RepID=UPI003F9E6DB9